MNRVYISQVQQLKCNFCTQWFSVPSQFANLQKYSLNSCQKCFQNFKYRLVDPSTYEIYDVVLIKTGVQLTNKQYQLTKKFQSLIKMHKDSYNLNQQSSARLKDEDLINSDIKAEVSMHIQPIKQKVSQTCRKFLDGLIKNWNQILSQIQKGSLQFDSHKEKIIKVLSDRYYNFSKDSQKLLSQERSKSNTNRLKQVSQQVKKITAQKMLAKIKSFIEQFFGINLKNNYQVIVTAQNKQNNTPNQKRNLKNIREKLIMRNSNKAENSQLKTNVSNFKQTKRSNGKSSSKNLLKIQVPPLGLKRQKSQKSITTAIKTPRGFLQQPQKEKPCHHLDQSREKLCRLLKQPIQFQSYMPIQPPKSDLAVERTYGQKCLIQYLIELKMKTTMNDNICQVINENLLKGNFACYLKSLQWRSTISIVRFVKVKIHDIQFDNLLHWLSDKTSVQILVVTNNFLTELSVEAIFTFCQRHRNMNLKQIYMGSNYIKPSKVKKSIQGLKTLGIEVYI